MQLTAMDIHQFINNPSGVELDTLASKVVLAFNSGSFNFNESAIAADIFRLLLKDAEKSVRATLAEHLYNNPDAPRDVIFRLACDEADISERVLRYSLVLTDDDLMSIVASTKEVLKLCAIAKRDMVSERISDALINTQQEIVLKDLFSNNGANISENSLTEKWGAISSNSTLLEVLAKRGGLPLTVAEKIFAVVSDELRNHISKEYRIGSHVAYKAAIDTREWELLGIMPVSNIPHPDDDERVDDLVEQLYATGRLTYSLVIRALCMGFLNLFEASLAYMAKIPRSNARMLLMGGHDGFEALYHTASMPEGFEGAVEKLLTISHKLIENIYVGGYHRSIEGMSYLLSIIDGKISGSNASQSVH